MDEIKSLKETKIQNLNYSIKHTLRLAFTFVILSAVVYAWLVIWAIVFIVAEPNPNIFLTLSYILYFVASLIGFLRVSISNLFIIYYLKKQEEINYFRHRVLYYVYLAVNILITATSVLSVVYYLKSILILGEINITSALASTTVGIILGCFSLFSFAGYISMGISYSNVVKKYKIEYAGDIQKEKERKSLITRQQAEEKQHEKELNAVIALLSKAGNKFFVKYYFELKDWSEPDILDIIQEDYTEETKIQRIRKGQEIFTKRLNKLALEIIADSANNSVDEETKQKANKLLEQIK